MRIERYTKYKIIFLLIITSPILFSVWKDHGPNLPQIEIRNYPETRYLTLHNKLSFAELSSYFIDLAGNKGAEYAYEVLKIAPMPPNIDMHLMGHVVGDILYKQQGASGISICTQDFRNACSHSIVVGLLLDKGDGVLPQIANICRKAPGKSGAYTMCFHGLGHGVLAYAGYDLPKAIKLCEKTGTKEYRNREAIECIGGGIMEMISGGFHDKELWAKQYKKYLSTTDPLSPCTANFMPKDAKPQCYLYITPYFIKIAGGDLGNPKSQDFEKAFKYCELINPNDSASIDACYGGFGKEFVGFASGRDIRRVDNMTNSEFSEVINWCDLVHNERGVFSCVDNALASIYWGGENNRNGAIRFCDIIKKDKLKSECFDSLINAVDYYIQDQEYRKQFCSELPKKEQALCKAKLI